MNKIILIIFFLFGIFLNPANATKIEVENNILLNGDFESELRYWQVEHPISWSKNKGKNGSGALHMNAQFKENGKYIYELNATECIEIDSSQKFHFEAKFKYKNLPIKSRGHRTSLVWYDDKNCKGSGQYGIYIEPKIVKGWQRMSKSSILPAFNAKSVMVKVTQNQKTSIKQLNWFDKVWKSTLDLFNLEYTPKLASGYWDELLLIPIETNIEQSTETSVDEVELANKFTLATGENYIKNSSFDNNKDHWKLHAKSELIATSDPENSGILQTTIESKKSSMGRTAFSQCINFGSQRYFDLSIMFRHNSDTTQTGGGRLRPTWYENENCRGRSRTSSQHADPKQIDTWQKLEVHGLESPEGTKSVKIQMIQTISGKGKYSAFWDDAYFRAISK